MRIAASVEMMAKERNLPGFIQKNKAPPLMRQFHLMAQEPFVRGRPPWSLFQPPMDAIDGVGRIPASAPEINCPISPSLGQVTTSRLIGSNPASTSDGRFGLGRDSAVTLATVLLEDHLPRKPFWLTGGHGYASQRWRPEAKRDISDEGELRAGGAPYYIVVTINQNL